VLTSVIILVASAVLLVYWARYTCLLLIASHRTKDYSKQVAKANQLSCVTLRQELASSDAGAALDAVFLQLRREYSLLTYLLRNSGAGEGATFSLEQWILRLDYFVMGLWFRVVRRLSGTLAREALVELAAIVSRAANAVGERVSVTESK
jgi:hypothetical protein